MRCPYSVSNRATAAEFKRACVTCGQHEHARIVPAARNYVTNQHSPRESGADLLIDRAQLEQRLQQAETHVAKGKQNFKKQHDLIRRLGARRSRYVASRT